MISKLKGFQTSAGALQSNTFQVEKEIRLADSGEADAISAVLYEAFCEFEPLYTAEGFAATTPKSEQIVERMSEGPVWVALVEGEIAPLKVRMACLEHRCLLWRRCWSEL